MILKSKISLFLFNFRHIHNYEINHGIFMLKRRKRVERIKINIKLPKKQEETKESSKNEEK